MGGGKDTQAHWLWQHKYLLETQNNKKLQSWGCSWRLWVIHGRRPGCTRTFGSGVIVGPAATLQTTLRKEITLGDSWEEAGPLALMALAGFY